MAHFTHQSPSSFLARTKTSLANWRPQTPLSWLAWTALPFALGASFIAFSQSTTPPAYQAVNLATEPLYAAVTVDKPALALALSVEYPTVGAQYLDTYASTKEYLGYYDAESCYSYNNAPTETVDAGLTTADYKRFDRTGPATSRQCTNAFSGNFLNWSSNSAIDMLRLALSGGDRYIDNDRITILQRAVLPNGDPVCFWNTSNFPSKHLPKDGGAVGTYWGAVPTAMITQAAGSDIYVANTLNRIYFGTSSTGGCGNTGAYTLGGPVTSTNVMGPIENRSTAPTITTTNPPPSSQMFMCIDGESGTCNFTGVKEVWYGAGTNWKMVPVSNGLSCPNGCNSVLGDPISGTAKKVYYRNYSGTWTPPASGTLNSDGFFYSRVQVCNVNNSGVLQDARDYGLCRQYPNGQYKPVGVIQKYSDQMRLSAFGYLMEQTASYSNGRYGGVLRAPMKYVGTKTFDVNGTDNTPAGGNSAAEWNATTGVFYPNPDGDTTYNPGISGVINYLNKFGRTGPVPGRYKRFDPVGELHYETIRYLQGLQPSDAATSGINTDMRDGFPVHTTWTDPYGGRSNSANYACVKSNIVVVGDTNTHDGNRLPTPSAANNIPDIAAWRTTAGQFESNATTQTYVDGQGVTRSIANPNTANNGMPTATDRSQIIGSAYWAHIHDIRGTAWTEENKRRPGLRVKTFIFDVNEGNAWPDPAVRATGNQFLMAAKYGGFETDPTNRGGKPYNTYGNPFKRIASPSDVNDNAVWQKAGTPGDPLTYYLQSNARGVLTAFDEIFSRASTSARSIAGGASSANSASSSTALYTARFDTSNWSGDVVAEPITADATTFALTVGAPMWSAKDRLDIRASAATSRNIVVGRASSTASPAGTNFAWANIDAGLQADLNKATPASGADTLGQDRLNFIRGDRTREGSPFRVRSTLLGDIVNSNVVFSGAPSKGFTGTGYAAFSTTYATRTHAVFAGGNDGMLHAFNASNGDELFGFIPSWLGPRLSALTDPTFATSHQNYVDAPMAVGEAQVAADNLASDWKTVLVSGTGGGGTGVFALDVSNPAAFDSSKVMWEFKKSDDADIGQVVGQPRIMKFKTSGNAATATYRWFAVVASGVNNYVADAAGRFSATGKPTLFLLALDKPVGTAWALNSNYFKISFPLDTALAATTAPGVVNFNALYGSSGEVTDIFIGDMHGKLWKLWFDPALTPTEWTMESLSYYKRGTTPLPMFVAKSGTTPQPITAPPSLFVGPTVAGLETFYVTFGSGKYLESTDSTSSLQNSFYALYDDGTRTADATTGDGAISGVNRLMAGTVNSTAKTVSVGAFTWGRRTGSTAAAIRSGWYFNLPTSGEKLVSHVLAITPKSGSFTTVIPGATGATAGSCSASPGSGNQYIFNVQDGSGRYVTSTVGLLGPAMFLTVDAETTDTKSDSTGRRVRTTVQRALTVGQSGVSPGAVESTKETVGRLTWRQIHNYQDQKN